MSFTKGSHTCAIRGCNLKHHKIYQFPNSRTNLGRFKKWLEAAGSPKFDDLSYQEIYKRGFVGRQHFQDNDHRRNGSKKLLRSAVPSLNLPLRSDQKIIHPVIDLPPMAPGASPVTVQLQLDVLPKEDFLSYNKIIVASTKRLTPSGSGTDPTTSIARLPKRRLTFSSPASSSRKYESVGENLDLGVKPLDPEPETFSESHLACECFIFLNLKLKKFRKLPLFHQRNFFVLIF